MPPLNAYASEWVPPHFPTSSSRVNPLIPPLTPPTRLLAPASAPTEHPELPQLVVCEQPDAFELLALPPEVRGGKVQELTSWHTQVAAGLRVPACVLHGVGGACPARDRDHVHTSGPQALQHISGPTRHLHGMALLARHTRHTTAACFARQVCAASQPPPSAPERTTIPSTCHPHHPGHHHRPLPPDQPTGRRQRTPGLPRAGAARGGRRPLPRPR